MGAVNIYVEGNADVKFLSDYVEYLGLGQLSKPNKHENNASKASLKKTDGADIFINALGGWTNVQNISPNIQSTLDDGGKVLIVFDADDNAAQRKREIISKVGNLSEKEVFLFPNDKDSGALEELLEKIVNGNNLPIFDCWDKYEKCLQSKKIIGRSEPLTTPAKKTKIYGYLEALLGETKSEKEKIKEVKRDYKDPSMWNLDAPYLEPLKNFLISAL